MSDSSIKDDLRVAIDEFECDREIAKYIRQLHLCIVKINIDTGRARVLHSAIFGDNGLELDWNEYLRTRAERTLFPEDVPRAVQTFRLHSLRLCAMGRKEFFSAEFLTQITGVKHMVSLLIFIPPADGGHTAFFALRNAVNNDLAASIINQFVYQNADYFIYIDAHHNTYNTFSAKMEAIVPPSHSDDYEDEVVKYALAYVAPEDQERVIAEMRLSRVLEQLDAYGVHTFTCGIIDPARGYLRKKITYHYHDKAAGTILVARTDITDIYLEMKEQQNKLELALVRAQTDPMTKLWNMQATMDKVNAACAALTAARVSDQPAPAERYGLLFIDLDNFKGINDTFGHAAGDQVLRDVAATMAGCTPMSGLTGRVGGDEFVVFTKYTDVEEITSLAESLNLSINSIRIGDGSQLLSGSVGIALAPEDGTSYYELLKKADAKLYKAKRTGKNKYCI